MYLCMNDRTPRVNRDTGAVAFNYRDWRGSQRDSENSIAVAQVLFLN